MTATSAWRFVITVLYVLVARTTSREEGTAVRRKLQEQKPPFRSTVVATQEVASEGTTEVLLCRGRRVLSHAVAAR